MQVGFEQPLALAAAPLLAAAALLARRSRLYSRLYGFWSPLAGVLGLEGRRPGRIIAVLELAAILLAVGAAAQPYLEYRAYRVRVMNAELRDALRVARPAVVILLDVSGSMGSQIPGGVKIAVAKRAVESFIDALPRNVDVGLVAFSHVVGAAVPPSGNRSLLLGVLEKLTPGGGTMYTYPLEAALNYLRPYRAFNATCMVVLVTDGLPADRGSYDRLLEEYRRLGIPVYTVYIGPGGDPGEAETRRIALLTGGRQYTASTAAELAEVFRRLASSARERIVETHVRLEAREEYTARQPLSWLLSLAAAAAWLAALYLRQRRLGVTF